MVDLINRFGLDSKAFEDQFWFQTAARQLTESAILSINSKNEIQTQIGVNLYDRPIDKRFLATELLSMKAGEVRVVRELLEGALHRLGVGFLERLGVLRQRVGVADRRQHRRRQNKGDVGRAGAAVLGDAGHDHGGHHQRAALLVKSRALLDLRHVLAGRDSNAEQALRSRFLLGGGVEDHERPAGRGEHRLRAPNLELHLSLRTQGLAELVAD